MLPRESIPGEALLAYCPPPPVYFPLVALLRGENVGLAGDPYCWWYDECLVWVCDKGVYPELRGVVVAVAAGVL